MPETAVLNFPSVKLKQPPRRQKSPKKRQTSGKREPKRNKSKHDNTKDTNKIHSTQDEIHIKNILNKKLSNDKFRPAIEKVTSTRVLPKNNDYGPIRHCPGFENPKLKDLRTHLFSIITCQWCHKLFNFKREPRIDKGITVCSDCVRDVLEPSRITAKGYFPLDLSYISAVSRVHQTLRIFQSETPYYHELERAICNKNSFAYSKRFYAADLAQKVYTLDCVKKYKDFLISENDFYIKTLFTKIVSVDSFKSNVMKTHGVGLCSLQLGALEIFENIEEYESLLHEPVDALPSPECLEVLYSQHRTEKPMDIAFSKSLRLTIANGGTEVYFYVDIDEKRLYAEVFGAGSTVFIDSFKPRFPTVTSVGLARIIRLEDKLLPTFDLAYFDISPGGGSLSKRYSGRGYRCFLNLGKMDYSFQTSKLFLGNKNACYLGAEIEVTEDKVLINYYMKDGKPTSENIKKPILWDYWYVPSYIRRGTIVSHSVDNINKLIIYKHDQPTELVNLVIGFVESVSYGSLMKFPLGKHKILSSGIGIKFDDKKENVGL